MLSSLPRFSEKKDKSPSKNDFWILHYLKVVSAHFLQTVKKNSAYGLSNIADYISLIS